MPSLLLFGYGGKFDSPEVYLILRKGGLRFEPNCSVADVHRVGHVAMRPEQFKAERYSGFKSNYAPPDSQFSPPRAQQLL